MKRLVMTVGLALSMIAGTGIGQADDKSGAASATQPLAVDTHEARAGLTALGERLLDVRAPLAERLSAARARQERLAALIADQPQVVLQEAMSAPLRGSLPSEVRRYLEEHVTIDGDLEVMHEDGPFGHRNQYFLNRGGERLALYFAAEAPGLQTGDSVRVSGVQVQQAMALSSGSSSVTVLALASANTFGPQRTAVILVVFQDRAAPTWLTAQHARSIILSDEPTSVSSFFRETSYGQTWLTGDVYGPYVIPVNTSCPTAQIASYGEQFAAAQVGAAKMATYTRFVYLFPGSGCGWWGFGTIGGSPSRLWVAGEINGSVVSHEMGHNFGLFHSHALTCDRVSVGPSCVPIEYGDGFDAMGDGDGHMQFNAVQKERLGWLNYGVSPPITTVQASGVYSIDPYEMPGSNPKALKVRTPSGDWYYAEYRQALGFDAAMLAGNANVTSGVLVHLWRGAGPSSVYLLDMTPTTPDLGHPALGVGDVFSDPVSGITIAPVWVNGTAGVNVTVAGSPTCVRQGLTVTASPVTQTGAAGARLDYMLSVTNNDTGCPAPNYTVQVTGPNGWLVGSGLTALAAGAAVTAVSIPMDVTSTISAAAGPYTISAKVFDAASPANPVTTQVIYQVSSGGGVLSDDFNRTDSSTLGNGWTLVAGGYAIQGGLAVGQAALNLAVQASITTNAAQAVFIRPTSASGIKFGVVVRYQAAVKSYYVCYRQAGGASQWKISKVVNGVETVLKAVPVSQAPIAAPFTVSCTASGSIISIGDGSAVKASVTNASLASGAVGIRTDKGVRVDTFTASAK